MLKNKAEIEFEKSLELRNFEIENLWGKRTWFFGGLLIAIAGGYYEIYTNDSNVIHQFCICLSLLAFIVSLAQSLMNRGSKYWQERWEYHAKHKESLLGIDVTKTEDTFSQNNYREVELIEAYILAKDDNFYTRSTRYSVSKLTFLVWDIITIFCFVVWLKDFLPHLYKVLDLHKITMFNFFRYKRVFSYIIVFHILVFIYIFLFLFLKRNWWKYFRSNWLVCESYKKIWNNFPISFCNGGGGKVYQKLGKNLKPERTKNKTMCKPKNTISRIDLEDFYKAGKG